MEVIHINDVPIVVMFCCALEFEYGFPNRSASFEVLYKKCMCSPTGAKQISSFQNRSSNVLAISVLFVCVMIFCCGQMTTIRYKRQYFS